MSQVRLVVVGAGLAGLRGAQAARRAGHDGPITIVGDEPYRPYNRPPLSKQVLTGESELSVTELPDGGLEADWILGNAAVQLDERARTLLLADGEEIAWDKCLIATGVRARKWRVPVPRGVHTLRGRDDAETLAATAADGPLVIIGAGFIGCEVAASMRALGRDVTVVDVAPFPLLPLGPELGGRARELHQSNGVRFHLGTGVTEIVGSPEVEGVVLTDGTLLPAATVLVAIGGVPNVEWLGTSSLPARKETGVTCDKYCLVAGNPDVAAAGDVASWQYDGRSVRVEHWSNAVEMGVAAATNLLRGLAEAEPFRPVPAVWSDQYGVRFQAIGLGAADAVVEVQADDPEAGSLILTHRVNGRLVRAASMGAAPRSMTRLQNEIRVEQSTLTAAPAS